MLRLLNSYSIPVRMWWYDLPDGTRVQHSDPVSLFRAVKLRNPDENRDYDEWYAEMVHHICLTLPKGMCIGDTDNAQRVEQLTFKKVQDFIKAVASVALSLAKGEPTHVDQVEADRRSFICGQCRYNYPITCLGCHGFLMLSHVYTRGREVKGQSVLGACGVCGCMLPVTVWCTKPILERVDKDHLQDFPEFCWRKELHHERKSD